jgi:Tol biopolymer transport system component
MSRPSPLRHILHIHQEITAMSRFRLVLTVLGTIAVQSAALAAQQAPAPRTLASFTDDSIQEFSVSPNGRLVLLGTNTKLRMYDVANRQSWDLASGNAEVLTWSPKGDRVAWTQGTDKSDANVWVMPVDAKTGRARGAAQRLTTGRSAKPAFSADGQWIAFVSFDSLRKMGLSIVPANGGPVRVVASRYMTEGMVFSADGKSIFVNGEASTPAGFGIVKVAVDGGKREVLPAPSGEFMAGATADRRYFILGRLGLNQMAGAGDSATIIDTTGHVVGHLPLPPGRVLGFPGILGDSAMVWITTAPDRAVIEVRPASGGSARQLPVVGESTTIPRWSPDGKRIAFQARFAGRTSLGVMNADGTDPRVYRETDVLANEYAVRWSPDSRLLAFGSADKGHLSVLDVAAGTIRQVLADSIGNWRWRSDGQAIVFRSRRMPGAGIDEVTLSGQRRQLLDWPLPRKAVNWVYVGDTSIFMFTTLDTAAYLKPLGPAPAHQVASMPPGWDLLYPSLSRDRQLVAGLLSRRDGSGWTRNQLALISLATGARRVLDLPFSWMTGSTGNSPAFLPGDSALLVFGQRPGDTGVKLFRVPTGGGAPSVVADAGAPRVSGEVFASSVSPDGRLVAYTVHPATAPRSLVLVDIRSAIPGASRAPRR